MIVYSTPERRQKRMKDSAKVAPVPPVPVPLNLVSAVFDHEQLTIALGFDRAINVDNMDVLRVQVDDGVFTHTVYRGNASPDLIDATTVRLNLIAVDASQGDAVLVNASDDNNIVAVNDGVHWLGVSGYPAN